MKTGLPKQPLRSGCGRRVVEAAFVSVVVVALLLASDSSSLSSLTVGPSSRKVGQTVESRCPLRPRTIRIFAHLPCP